ncbi:MAG: sialidase family protein [Acidimicrobiales bacterium]
MASGAAVAADPPTLTTPVQVTKGDLDPQRTYSGPSLLVHPDNPEVIVAGSLEFRSRQCRLMRSTDGGGSWRILDNPPALASYPFCLANNSNTFQAPLAWGGNDTLYMLTVGWDTQDTRSKVSIVVHRSTDLGDSWTSHMVRDARATDEAGDINENNRPATDIVVDRKGGTDDIVYVTYRRGYSGTQSGNGRPSTPMVGVSTDGGRTFAEPAPLVAGFFEQAGDRGSAIQATTTVPPTSPTTAPAAGTLAAQPDQGASFGGGNPSITIDDKGTVYGAWKSASSNISPSPPPGVFVSRSSDRGATWTVTQVRPFSYENGSAFVIPQVKWSSGGGSNGTLHLVYDGSDRPEIASYANVYYTRSTDGGRTWSEPSLLPDEDPALLNGKFIPNMSVAPNGRVDVAWWDTRDDPGIRANDVYYTYSQDNGRTWAPNIRVTDQVIDRRLGVWGNNFDQNSPPGIASVNAYAILGWDDTRFSRGEDGNVEIADPISGGEGIGGGIQDVFISSVQFAPVGGGTSSAAKIALAGVVGLLAVGVILLITSRFTGDRSGADGENRRLRNPAKVG